MKIIDLFIKFIMDINGDKNKRFSGDQLRSTSSDGFDQYQIIDSDWIILNKDNFTWRSTSNGGHVIDVTGFNPTDRFQIGTKFRIKVNSGDDVYSSFFLTFAGRDSTSDYIILHSGGTTGAYFASGIKNIEYTTVAAPRGHSLYDTLDLTVTDEDGNALTGTSVSVSATYSYINNELFINGSVQYTTLGAGTAAINIKTNMRMTNVVVSPQLIKRAVNVTTPFDISILYVSNSDSLTYIDEVGNTISLTNVQLQLTRPELSNLPITATSFQFEYRLVAATLTP